MPALGQVLAWQTHYEQGVVLAEGEGEMPAVTWGARADCLSSNAGSSNRRSGGWLRRSLEWRGHRVCQQRDHAIGQLNSVRNGIPLCYQ